MKKKLKIDWLDFILRVVGIINGTLAIISACFVDSESMVFAWCFLIFGSVAGLCYFAWNNLFMRGE